MKSFLSTLSSICRQKVCRPRYDGFKHARSVVHSVESQVDALTKANLNPTSEPPLCTTFDAVGLHPPIVTSLRAAFPNVQHPTNTQSIFIPAILSGKDVLLKDVTGSGKSFGLVLALLNKPRILPQRDNGRNQLVARHITSLVIVPHRDLAYQLYHWILRITSVAESPSEMSTIAQVLVRDGGSHLDRGLYDLHKTPPHILIGTPQAIMDVYQTDARALQFKHLSSVVVDEVDYLIDTAPRKDPNRSFYQATVKAKRKLLTHPGITRQLLDIIFAARKEINARQKDEPGAVQHRRKAELAENSLSLGLPQLILSSATLRSHLSQYLFEESGWLNKDNLLKVKGTKRPTAIHGKKQGTEKYLIDELGGSKVSHSVLIVSEEGIENIAGAGEVPLGPSEKESLQPIDPQTLFAAEAEPERVESDPDIVARYEGTPSPFNPNALEAIATAFALDVPTVGLLVLASSSPVQRAVYELREMGINAQRLDLGTGGKSRSDEMGNDGSRRENPIMFVSTLATTRGLDLPALTHVFILGIPDGPKVNGKTVDAYVHLAGRVGRFGGEGKVITVVEDSVEGSKMLRILQTLNERPVRFSHFD